MNKVIMGVLFAILGASLACAQRGDDSRKSVPSATKLTREYLLAYGFKESADPPTAFTREHVRLGDVLRDLGLPLASLRPVVNQEGSSDIRSVDLNGIYALVQSEVRDNEGRVIAGSLDDPNARCSVTVDLNPPAPPKERHLITDSTPRMRINAVVPDKQAKSLEVTLNLSATGSKPVAMRQSSFYTVITGSNQHQESYGVEFPSELPKIITVFPEKPIVVKVTVPVKLSGTNHLSPGEYLVRIGVGSPKPGPQAFDYELQGVELWSDDYKFIVK